MLKPSGILAGLLVLVLFAILAGSTSWWLQRNELPDGFQNEYEHSYTLTEVFFRLRDVGWQDAQGPLWSGYYPPLEHVVASIGMAIGGRSHRVAVLSLSVFLLLLLGSAAALGRGLRDASTGAFAAGLLASYPSVFGNARRYEPNIALAALVAAALALLILRGGLPRRRVALAFGLLCGLGMLADRLVFAAYLLPAVALCLFALRSELSPAAAVRRWSLAALAALAVCGAFYVRFFRLHVWEVWTQLGGEVNAAGADSQALPPWTPTGLLYYPLSFLDSQMGLVSFAVTVAGLLLWGLRGRSTVDVPRRRLLEATAFGGLLLLTLIAKKQPFYSIPLLMPLTILAALGWRALPSTGLRRAIVTLLVIGGVHQLTFLTRGEGLFPTPGRWAWFAGVSPLPPDLLGTGYTQAWAPREQRIDLDRAVALCAAERAPDRPHVMLFSDAHAVYEGQLLPAARLGLDTLLVDGVTMLPEAVADHHAAAACFLYVTDTALDWPTAASIQAQWDRRGLGAVPPATLRAVDSLGNRARLLAAWPGEPEGRVRVFGFDRR